MATGGVQRLEAMLEALRGKRIWICSLGCRSNQYEGEALANAFLDVGAILSETPSCDAAVLVSCTVTAEADRKCRQAIRRARRTSPGAVIAACGCWAQKLDAGEASLLGIHMIVGNRKKGDLPALLAERLESGGKDLLIAREDVLSSRKWDPLVLSRPVLHTRAFIKIQDGCNHFCSYCAIPWVRGFPVSRPLSEVEKEVRRVVESGCSEVVLTGIHLGLYGRREGMSLAGLVRLLASVRGLKRIRFGSLEPFGLDHELLDVLAETPLFCPHLHLPLQSGSPSVLSLMKRGYGPGEFIRLVERVRSRLGEDVHVSTDILVGFPGEDEDAFSDTLSVMKECRFGKVHVFPFSPREGTEAASFPGRVSFGELAVRKNRALAQAEDQLRAYCARWVGRDQPVLVEQVRGSSFQGLTPSFLRVTGKGGAVRGEEKMVRITRAGDDCLRGRPLP